MKWMVHYMFCRCETSIKFPPHKINQTLIILKTSCMHMHWLSNTFAAQAPHTNALKLNLFAMRQSDRRPNLYKPDRICSHSKILENRLHRKVPRVLFYIFSGPRMWFCLTPDPRSYILDVYTHLQKVNFIEKINTLGTHANDMRPMCPLGENV